MELPELIFCILLCNPFADASDASNQTINPTVLNGDDVKADKEENGVEGKVYDSPEDDVSTSDIHNGHLLNCHDKTPAKVASVTRLSSQPLKNLARQLQVSSSFRVEKKVAQVMEELGLFPLALYLNHRTHWPSSQLYWSNQNQVSGDTATMKPEQGATGLKQGFESDPAPKLESLSPLHVCK